jgi:hypothetical protein
VKADFLEREAVLSLFMVTFDLLTIRKGSWENIKTTF